MTLVLAIPLIMIGGAIGAIGRYLVLNAVASWTRLPGWGGIMFVNVIGSFLAGFFVHWIGDEVNALPSQDLSPMSIDIRRLELQELLALCAIGFCGAFTTFSSFSLDNYFLSIEGRGRLLFNIAGSVLLCFAAVYGGWALGSAVVA